MEEKSCEVVEGSHTAGGGGGENMPRGMRLGRFWGRTYV